MVSFNTLAVCVSALASVCCARSGHAHMRRGGHLQARAGYNGTETTILLPIGTGVVHPPADYTSTVTQTNIKFVTVTYTLGNGAVKTTVITKAEETVQTVAHVKSIVTVAPIIETTALALIPSFTSVASAASAASVASVASVASSVKPKSTSTRTLVVTVNGSETTTVSIAAETAPPVNIAAEAVASSASACSVQTVYVPQLQYVTLYSTVTVAATSSAVRTSIMPPYSNNTMTESSRSFESTSTTTMSVYTTVYIQPSAI